jgi:hypothetical protein
MTRSPVTWRRRTGVPNLPGGLRIAGGFALFLIAAAWTAQSCAGEEVFLSSGERVTGILRSLKKDGSARIWFKETGVSFAPGKVVKVVFSEPSGKSTPPDVIVDLRGGSRLSGPLAAESPQGSLRLECLFGTVELPFQALDALRFPSPGRGGTCEKRLAAICASPPREKDALLLWHDGELVRVDGFVQTLDATALRFAMGEKERRIVRARIVGVVFARSGEPPEPARGCGAIRATLKDSDHIAGWIVGLEWGLLTVRTPAGPVFSLPLSSIARLELGSDRVKYLSDTVPTSVKETPFFNLNWPHRMDQSVGGRPMRLAGKTYAKGIGMHARCRLTFAVPPGFRKFIALIGIDDETRKKGNAVFRVYLDRKMALEVLGVRGGEKPRLVELDLGDAASITLEVDSGEEMDVGDHADWAEARIVKD